MNTNATLPFGAVFTHRLQIAPISLAGFMIDMRAMNKVSVSDDNTITSVGEGATWIDLDKKLDALNLAVRGGCLELVGVGHFITGGLLRFLSPMMLNLTS